MTNDTIHPRSPLARLFAAPGRFDFFQAVRLLERLATVEGGMAVGGDTAPEQEAVHLGVLPALRFAEGPVAKVVPGIAGEPPALWATFGGLTGPDGILPQHYTALLLARQRLKDTTLRDWLDLFHHRLLSLLTRAWEKNRWAAVVGRNRTERRPVAPRTSTSSFGSNRGEVRAAPARFGNDDALTSGAFALAGFGTPGLRERLGVPDDTVVFYAGLLSRQPRTANGLEQILSEYFGWPMTVEQYNGQWLYLDAENKAELPMAGRPGLNVSLGRDVVIGRRVWDVQGKVRVVVGPLDGESFRSLLPGGDARKPLSTLIRLYLGLELEVEVRLVLSPDEVPWCSLEYDENRGPKLGRNTWVRSHNFGRPVGDAAFTAD